MIVKSIYLDKFVSIDLETTGLNYSTDKIIELSAVKYESGNVIDVFTKLINPNKVISPFIENFTGIKNSDVNNKESFLDISNDFMAFIKDLPIVGHNIQFDLIFLDKALNNTHDIYNQSYICDTYYLSKIFLYSSNSFKLQSLCHDFDIEVGNSHRAEDDARSAGDLFLVLLEIIQKLGLNTINDIYNCYKDNMFLNKDLFYHIINNKILNNETTSNDIDFRYLHTKNSYEYKGNHNQDLNFEEIYLDNGILDTKIDNYEFRSSQYEFSKDVLKSFNDESIFIAEAETGLGKSFGYLVPAMLNSFDNKILISTSTHNLQEQLFNKDIPSLSKALDISIKASIVKGMKNYVCVYRLKKLLKSLDLLDKKDIYELLSLLVWIKNTKTGDISECNSFPINRLYHLWDLITYDYQFCSFHSTNNLEDCFYNKLKKEIPKSNLLVINHSLLATCYNKDESILDKFNYCIIDEAHKTSENCRMYLKEFISLKYIQGLFDSYNHLLDKIISNNSESDNYSQFINAKTKIELDYDNFIVNYKKITNEFAHSNLLSKVKRNGVYDIKFNVNEIDRIEFNSFIDLFLIVFENLNDILDLIDKSNLLKLSSVNKLDLSMSYNKFEELKTSMYKVFIENDNQIKWISSYVNNNEISSLSFNTVPLVIRDIFDFFYNKFDSMVLTSATLTVDDSFDYILNELGVDNFSINKSIKTKKFPSPFFLSDQIRLFVNNSNFVVDSDEFINDIKNIILDIRREVPRRMLVLCTSYKQIISFKNLLSNIDNIYFQDKTTSKEILIKNYLSNDNSILFGTSSFWEGVDLPNDKLEILIILKVPFSNPYNPIVQAKIEQYKNKNMDPFINYQLSEAILKLKQGFGRLIRHQDDIGVCILADPRVLNKSYGQIILDSLPVDYINYNGSAVIINEIDKFLGK
jgi:predicted DnaQ family exonuclease/DinG family helicase